MHNDFEEFIKEILKYKTISIIGMEKNTGKTTTLNFIINVVKDRKLALTSVGRDGEEEDIVTFTHKPRIYVQEGTLVATAKNVLLKSDVGFEILEVLNIGTPMGDIVIAKSITAGFVEIAGPATKNQIKEVIYRLKFYGADFILVDGALSRKSFAAPTITEAAVMCTGAAFSEKVKLLCEETLNFMSFLRLPKASEEVSKLYEKVMEHSRLAFIYENCIKKSKVETAISSYEEVISNYSKELNYVFIKGILTDNFILKLLASNFVFKKIIFVVEDGTKIFVKKSTYDRFILKGGSIKATQSINVVGISVNPWSPSGYVLNYEEIYNMFKSKIDVPIFNVREYEVDVIE